MKKAMSWVGVMLLLVAGVVVMAPRTVQSHCQLPCGIYDDAARIKELHEDVTTIAKAIDEINSLAGKTDGQSANQLVRWVEIKDKQASHIITTISEYFLAQRIKPVDPGADGYDLYLKKLAEHHAVMVAAMKTKQHTDTDYSDALHAAIQRIERYYVSEDEK